MFFWLILFLHCVKLKSTRLMFLAIFICSVLNCIQIVYKCTQLVKLPKTSANSENKKLDHEIKDLQKNHEVVRH